MTEHHASIHWQRIPVGSDYSRDHHWSIPNGARVAASASAALVPPPLTGDQRFDPEQGFVASIAACHMLWFLTLAEQRGWPVQGYVDQAVGVLAKPAGGRLSITEIRLSPRVRFADSAPTSEVYRALHEAAHERCFLAQSITARVDCQPSIDADDGAATAAIASHAECTNPMNSLEGERIDH